MSKNKPKNVGRSIRERLMNLKKAGSHEYMYILQRYFNERLLYRVSVSQYCEHFLLRGGSLLYAHNGLNCRPTVDVDFLANRISRNQDELMRVKRWKKFLKDIKYAEELSFEEVMAYLKEKLEKYWSEDFLNE